MDAGNFHSSKMNELLHIIDLVGTGIFHKQSWLAVRVYSVHRRADLFHGKCVFILKLDLGNPSFTTARHCFVHAHAPAGPERKITVLMKI